ncbi:type II secretion system F family protein [Lysinibacillus antri]|uniref:Type II secretion system F family protein n=1 Tax=Lysinibacillus antri TaxID=2498145 RepID=A0A3S0P2S4_9BACI|nr:type II secretion system F family protein [Lysinibacillus antri]RUL49584.1 type II secretion system F family protein [Lysinibacillus antri]
MVMFLFLLNCLVFLILITAGILLTVFRKEILIERRITGQFGSFDTKKTNRQNIKGKQIDNFFSRVLGPSWIYIRKKVIKTMSKGTMKELEKRVRDAGRPFQLTAVDFRVAQISLGIYVFLSSIFFIFLFTFNIFSSLIVATALGGIAFIVPSFYLDYKKKKRIRLIEKNMSDFFDMVTLSIEAGMGLEQAISNVCRQTKGPISEEFLVTLEDMKLGKSRREAFFALRNRVPSDHFQSIITSIIQASELGIGMGNLMRSLTQRIREHQREKIREKGMKAPVKMLFPMVFFIFPSLFIVILGPLAVDFLVNGLF